MKTAISIPDDVYEAAERTAKRLKVSRSRLYTKAVQEFVERHDREGLTEKLNEVYKCADLSAIDPLLHVMQLQSLRKEDWD